MRTKDGDGGVGRGYRFPAKRADRRQLRGAGVMGLGVEELDECRDGLFDGVLGREGADDLADGKEELVCFFRCWVVVGGHVGGVGGFDDGTGRVVGAPGEALPEFFGKERHEGVDHREAGFEGGVESVDCAGLFFVGAVCDDNF